MTEKSFFIDEYFKMWEGRLEKANQLLSDQRYYLEGMLVLSCYLGAFAAMRYPKLKDGERYVRFVLEYSGKGDLFHQIDLLFFYQWPRSKLRDHGKYKELKQHTEIVAALQAIYGNEENLRNNTRYVPPSEFIIHVKAAKIPGLYEENIKQNIHLFSLAELLYRYLRCDAVHNPEFPFINEIADMNGNIVYEHNNAITEVVLLDTTRGAWRGLWEECRRETKWPHEL